MTQDNLHSLSMPASKIPSDAAFFSERRIARASGYLGQLSGLSIGFGSHLVRARDLSRLAYFRPNETISKAKLKQGALKSAFSDLSPICGKAVYLAPR